MANEKRMYDEVFEDMEKILNGTEENPNDPIWCAIMIHYYMSEITDQETGKKFLFPHIMWSDLLISNGKFHQETRDYYKGKEYPAEPRQENKKQFYTPEYIRTIHSNAKTKLEIVYYRRSTAFVPSPEEDGSLCMPDYQKKTYFVTSDTNG